MFVSRSASRRPVPRIRISRIRRLAAIASALALIAGVLLLAASLAPAARARAATALSVGGCPLFPADNIWNADISALPTDPGSARFIASIGATGHLHPDFGAGLYAGGPIGIPYVVVPASQSAVPISFDYADESDAGPYPIPPNAPIEGGAQSGGDRHVLVVQSGACILYEMFASVPQSGGWHAGSGAVWHLGSDALRPAGWTSADAAGLPILPGLVRYDEVAGGIIAHALRFTVGRTRDTYIWPARHQASSQTDPALPPMGLRLRLKAGVDISSFSPTNQVILTALKHYGMLVADNGSSWFLSGAPDDRWNNDDLAQLKAIGGADFEVVDTSGLRVNPDSGATGAVSAPAATPAAPATPSPTPPTRTPIPPRPTATAPARGPALPRGQSGRPGLDAGKLLLAVAGVGIALAFVGARVRRQFARRRTPE